MLRGCLIPTASAPPAKPFQTSRIHSAVAQRSWNGSCHFLSDVDSLFSAAPNFNLDGGEGWIGKTDEQTLAARARSLARTSLATMTRVDGSLKCISMLGSEGKLERALVRPQASRARSKRKKVKASLVNDQEGFLSLCQMASKKPPSPGRDCDGVSGPNWTRLTSGEKRT